MSGGCGRRRSIPLALLAAALVLGACGQRPAAVPSPAAVTTGTTAVPSGPGGSPTPARPGPPSGDPTTAGSGEPAGDPSSDPATEASADPATGNGPDPSAAVADPPPLAAGADPGGNPGGDTGAYPARPTDQPDAPDDQYQQDVWAPAGDHRVPGTLTLPVADGRPAPAVLLLHGDFGDRHASEFDELEQVLAARGIASLAIDFAGSGESEESQLDLSYGSMLTDANAALDYLAGDPDLDPARLAVLGFSRGGSIAATMAGTRPDVAALVSWSGAVYNGFDELPDLHEQARVDGMAQVGDDLEIPLAWFDSIEASHPLDDVAGYTGPVLAVVGSDDDVVDPSYARTFLDTVAGSDKTLHVIEGAGHGLDDEPEYGQEAVDTTADWLVARCLP